MLFRSALCAVAATALLVFNAPLPSLAQTQDRNQAQTPAQTPAAPEAKPTVKPDAAPAAPASPPAAATTPQGDPFGEDAMLTSKPVVFLKGTGTWDSAFATITNSFKTIKNYIGKEGLQVDGQPMTIFTATDDNGFQFQAAIPVTEPPKTPPRGELGVGKSPEGHALKFVHRGSYDGLDNTYEAITNYLDDHRLEAKDMFIEQYLTDPLTTNQDHLVVNVYVLIKQP